MSSNFDWRAEDDANWNKYHSGGPDDENQPSNGKRPTRLIILGALLIVVVAGVFAYFQLRRYVENTAESVEEDVLSSHALVKLAAEGNDLELLAPLLSGRDPKWTQDQLALLDMNLLLDRRPFGLTWQPQETGDEISVTLAPDLQSAEIEYQESYGYGLNGEEGGIQLTQTAVYRLSETRWLLSPPNDDFWGGWISSKGRYITLTFPNRDEEVGLRLASDLEAALAGACLNLDLACDSSRPLDVLLATDLDAMMDIGNPEFFAQEGDQLVLPAPTLVGKPANNAGYRILYRGYAAFVVSRLIARQANWECCRQSPYFKAMVDVQLQQLSLQTWPLTMADYRLALRRPISLTTIRTFWEGELSLTEFQDQPDWWMLYSFIEFLLNQGNQVQVIELERALAETNSFNRWLTDAGLTGSMQPVVDDWRDFAQQKILQTQEQPPIDWPEEDIALSCSDGVQGLTNIYRYDPAEDKWGFEIADRDYVVMNGLPDHQGLILVEQLVLVDKLRTTVWRDGKETLVTFGDGFFYSADLSDPANRFLVINSFQPDEFNEGIYESGVSLLELDNCNDEGCPLTPIEGIPAWSPDGSRTLWTAPETEPSPNGENQIYLGDSQLQAAEPVATGFAPFWLDTEHYAFFRNPMDKILLTGGIDDRSPEQILSRDDLAALLPEIEAADLGVNNTGTNPAAPDLIFITADNRFENLGYLFALNWQTGELKLVFTAERSFGGLNIHSFSPDNRWLALTTYTTPAVSGESFQEIFLYNLESQETQSYELFGNTDLRPESWSNNGEWLLFQGQNFLILSAPAAGYDHLIRHNFRDCTAVAWIR